MVYHPPPIIAQRDLAARSRYASLLKGLMMNIEHRDDEALRAVRAIVESISQSHFQCCDRRGLLGQRRRQTARWLRNRRIG